MTMKKLLLILLCLPMFGFGQSIPPNQLQMDYFDSFEAISPNTYRMYKVDRRGIFGKPSKMRSKVREIAQQLATSNGFDLKFISDDIHPMGIAGDWATYTYIFRLTYKTTNESLLASEEYEKEIRQHLDENAVGIEGIWEFKGNENYRLAVIKEGYKYKATIIDGGNLYPGDLKATIEVAASDELLTINWIMADKSTNKLVGILKNNALITIGFSDKESVLYKIYPKLNATNKKVKNSEWAGNGSGIIISKSGYIITNNHVIEDAEDIEVEFILDDEVQKFNAEVIQSDKVNDLAIIKIVDVNFDGVKELPYNFKARSSDVGTKVYAFGYPMALSIMGKEVKVTDGMISSKTGFDGNITTYQITAPIQAGNSGGPLFDEKGNLIGINSSGIRKDIADNVAYSIKTNYVINLIDILPKSIDLPSNNKLESLSLTEQIKEISKYVVLIKVK